MPTPATVLWPDRTSGPFAVTFFWQVAGGVARTVGMQVTTWRTDDPITRNLPESGDAGLPRIDGVLLRRIPVATLAQESRERFATLLTEAAGKQENEQWQFWLEQLSTLVDKPKRGGRDLGDAHYRDVASVYAKAVQDGDPPTIAVRDAFQISKSSAANRIARARARGYLPATSRGRVGPLTTGVEA